MGPGTIVSELRANFMDFVTYVLPGGLLLLAVVAAVSHVYQASLTEYLVETLFGPLGGTPGAAMGVAVLLAMSYALGMVVRVLDDVSDRLEGWAQKRLRAWGWFRKRFGRNEDAGAESGEGFAFARLKEYAAANWGWKQEADAEDKALGRLLAALVDSKAPGCALWVYRFLALANFCGALAWVVLLSTLMVLAFALSGAQFRPLGLYLLAVPVIGLALFLALGWGKRDFATMADQTVDDAAFHLAFADEPKPEAKVIEVRVNLGTGGGPR